MRKQEAQEKNNMYKNMDELFLLAIHNKALLNVLDDLYEENIRLDGNSHEEMVKISALLSATLKNAQRLEKICYKIMHCHGHRYGKE